MPYRVTIREPGKRLADGRFANAEPDSKGRYYRLFHYKEDADSFVLELMYRGMDCAITSKNAEPL